MIINWEEFSIPIENVSDYDAEQYLLRRRRREAADRRPIKPDTRPRCAFVRRYLERLDSGEHVSKEWQCTNRTTVGIYCGIHRQHQIQTDCNTYRHAAERCPHCKLAASHIEVRIDKDAVCIGCGLCRKPVGVVPAPTSMPGDWYSYVVDNWNVLVRGGQTNDLDK